MKPIFLLLALLAFTLSATDRVYRFQGKGDQFTRDKDGIYVWFALGLRPLPGEYKVVGRIRSANPGTFMLRAMDQFTDKEHWKGSVKTSGEYQELEFGAFHYDGNWPVRLVDWNAPGHYLEWIELRPVSISEVPQCKGDSADSTQGWVPLFHTKIVADKAVKKEGQGALKIDIDNTKGAPWYDVGVMRRVSMKEVSTVSFWIRFDETVKPVWVQLIGGTDSGVMRFKPEEFGVEPGKWKLVELPVSSFHFKPERPVAKDIRAVAVNLETGKEKVSFRIDDLLLE